jgi:hypothetical protein
MGEVTMTGPIAIGLMVLTVVLGVGSVAMIADAIRRSAESWRRRWSRWVWVAFGSAYLIELAGLFVVRAEALAAAFGPMLFATLVAEILYLLKVVYPAPPR